MGIATASSYLLTLVWGSKKGGPSLCPHVWQDVCGRVWREDLAGRRKPFQARRSCFCLFVLLMGEEVW